MFRRLSTSVRHTTRDLPASFWILWIGTLVNRLGLFVAPFMTLYLKRERGATVEEATFIVTLLGLGSFLSAIIGGVLSDRLGRKPTFVLSMLLTAVMLLALGAAENIVLIGIFTLLLGFVGDLYRPAISAIVADIVPPDDRIRAFSLIYWAINLGSAIAPVIAGIAVQRVSYSALFIGDAITTLAFGLLIWWQVPETRPAEAAARSRTSNPFGQFRAALRDVRLVTVTLLALCFAFITFQAFTTLPLAMELEGLTELDYSGAISLNGFVIILISIPVAAWATRRPRYKIMAGAAALFGIGFGSHAFANGILPLYMLGVVIWTIGELTSTPVGTALVSDLAPADLRGTYMGVFGMAWGLGSTIAPLIGGLILARAGSDALWLTCLGVGLISAVGWWMAGRAFQPRPRITETVSGDQPRPA